VKPQKVTLHRGRQASGEKFSSNELSSWGRLKKNVIVAFKVGRRAQWAAIEFRLSNRDNKSVEKRGAQSLGYGRYQGGGGGNKTEAKVVIIMYRSSCRLHGRIRRASGFFLSQVRPVPVWGESLTLVGEHRREDAMLRKPLET